MNLVFLTLLCLPVVEIAVLITVGGAFGLALTIALVLLTALIGTVLLRQQGLSLLFTAQQQISQGQIPAQTMVEGVAIAVGGALLLTPGFVTDILGFMCLIPLTRQMLLSVLKRRMSIAGAGFVETSENLHARTEGTGVTLEGEYRRDE